MAAITAGAYRCEDFFEGSGPKSTVTFREYANEWLETLTVEKSTRRSYRTAISATWAPAFADKQLAEIRYSDIKRAIADKAKTATGKAINNHLIPLRAILDMAVRDGLLRASPAEGVGNLKHQAAEPDPFSVEEKDLFLMRIREHYDERAFNYFDFAFHTGLRPSEQIALKWGDIDWLKRTAKIERAQVDYEEKGAKTNRVRHIDLNDRALAALTRQKAHTFMRGEDAYVFTNPNTGYQWQGVQAQLRCFWNPTLRALGLRRRDAYQTRHTFASTLLMGGSNPAWIARQLGHASTAMVFKVYARWIEGADKGAEAAKANAILSRNCPRADTAS